MLETDLANVAKAFADEIRRLNFNDCGLPDDRFGKCELVYSIAVQGETSRYMILKGRTVETIRALTGDVRSNGASGVTGVISWSPDALIADLDPVAGRLWVFGAPDALRRFHRDGVDPGVSHSDP